MGTGRTRIAIELFAAILTLGIAAPGHGQTPPAEPDGDHEDWEVRRTDPSQSPLPNSFRFLTLGFDSTPAYGNCAQSLIGNYTRIRIERTADTDLGHPIPRRSSFDRFFVGRRVSRIIVARAKLSRPTLNSTVSLASIQWDSSKKGQISEASLTSNAFTTPFFRVDPDATVQVEFQAVGSSGVSITLASDALSIISDVAKPLGGANFVNAENLPQLQRVATAVDTAISKFFKESITETQTRELSLQALMRRPLRASVLVPYEWTVVGEGRDKSFGAWTIYVAKPRRSIFAQQMAGDVCSGTAIGSAGGKQTRPITAPYEHLTPTQIGQFPLTSTETLLQHLAGSEQIGAAVTDLELAADQSGKNGGDGKAPPKDVAEQARELHLLILTEAQRLGFNVPDAYAISQAFAYSGRFHRAAREALLNQTRREITLAADSAIEAQPTDK